MIVVTRIVLLSFLAVAESTAAQMPSQSSLGDCSPNVSNTGGGTVTIQFLGSACQGVDPTAIKKINEFLATYPAQLNLSSAKIRSRALGLTWPSDAVA